MPAKPSARALKREARASLYFAMYAAMGANRSLTAVSAAATAAGVPVTHATLADYSKAYGWQAKVAEYDGKSTDAVQNLSLASAIAGKMEQDRLARVLTNYGAGVITAHLTDAKGKPRDLVTEDPANAVRALAEGFKMLRLVSGQATEIRDITVQFMGLVMHDISDLWVESLRVSHETYAPYVTDPEVRQRAHLAAQAVFARADVVLQRHLTAMGLDVTVTQAGVEDEGDD